MVEGRIAEIAAQLIHAMAIVELITIADSILTLKPASKSSETFKTDVVALFRGYSKVFLQPSEGHISLELQAEFTQKAVTAPFDEWNTDETQIKIEKILLTSIQ